MPKGKVKWFNQTKGYGFIAPEDGDKDVFVHITAVRNAGMNNLEEDQEVEFEIVEKNGKASACLLYTSPSPRDRQKSRMPSSA